MPMKVILRTDVDNLGRLGDQVSVKLGYARNFLLPMGLAMLDTKANRKQFETEKKKLQAKVDAAKADAQGALGKLNGQRLTMAVRVGEGEKLYGSVTAANIAEVLEQQTGQAVDKRKIVLPSPIRSLGEYEIPIKLHTDVTAVVTVNVIKFGHVVEEEAPAPAAAPAEAPAAPAE